MNRTFAIVASVLVLSLSLAAQDPRQVSVTLKAAQAAESIEQDLPKAVALYERALKEAGSDRVLVPQILLQLAQAQGKAGRTDDARGTYEVILRDHSKSGEPAAVARRRLQELAGPVATAANVARETSRPVWTLPAPSTIKGAVSGDGRYVAHGERGSILHVRDLTTGADRLVVPPGDDSDRWTPDASALSSDGRKIAYRARARVDPNVPNSPWKYQFRVVEDVPGSQRPPQYRVLLDTDAVPYDWTPDGKWIAVRLRKDGAAHAIGLVSAADGVLRILTTLSWPQDRSTGISEVDRFNGFLSRDGKYLAFEVPTNAAGVRDISILPMDGGSEVRAVQWSGDDILLGWSPDNTSLLFSSDRLGEVAIWGQGITAGHAVGDPKLVRRAGPRQPRGLTRFGSLYSEVDNGAGASVKLATFDFATGAFVSAPKDVSDTFVRSSMAPRFSPNGTFLGYMTDRGVRGSENVLVLLNLRTGATREVRLNFYFLGDNRHRWDWMPDSKSIVVQGEDPDRPGSRNALHRIDVETGKVSPLVPDFPGNTVFRYIHWSPDGQILYYFRAPSTPKTGSGWVRAARDVETGIEREMGRADMSDLRSVDGTKIYTSRRNSSSSTFVERDVATEVERDLFESLGYSLSEARLTTDGRSIIAPSTDASTNEGLVIRYSIGTGFLQTVFRGPRGRQVFVDLMDRNGQSIIVRSPTLKGINEFFWVPLDGRPSRPLQELAGVNPVVLGARTIAFELHPDGKTIAFGTTYERTMGDQLFVLENFLPAVKR